MRKSIYKLCLILLSVFTASFNLFSNGANDDHFNEIFPLTAEGFNPSIWAEGTFDEATGTLVTGQWGAGGWVYPEGVDVSGYKYLVLELNEAQTCGATIHLRDENSYWAKAASFEFGSETRLVINLSRVVKDLNEPLNLKKVHYVNFWSHGGCPIKIKDVFLTNSDEYLVPGQPECQHIRRKINVAGKDREMLVYVPHELPENSPLMVSFAGMGLNAAIQADAARFWMVADTAKFAVVYPDPQENSWDMTGDSDIKFFLAILDEMSDLLKIDKKRVYISGFSWGGNFCYRLAKNVADKIAAMGPVMGHSWGPNLNSDYSGEKSSSHPMPIHQVTGIWDDLFKPEYVQPVLDKWIGANGCSTTPTEINPYPVGSKTSSSYKKTWRNEQTGVEVVLIMTPHGHSFPNDPKQVMSNLEVWNFCRRYSLDSFNTSAIGDINSDTHMVLSEEYYTLLGQKVCSDKDMLKGVYVVKQFMSNNTISSKKVYLK